MHDTDRAAVASRPLGALLGLFAYALPAAVGTVVVIVGAVAAGAFAVGVAMSGPARKALAALRHMGPPVRPARVPRPVRIRTGRRWHRAGIQVAAAGVGAMLAAVAVAFADVAGPDETPAQAYGPMQPGMTYAGTFKTPTDVDHLSFKVDRAGETLRFTIYNTTQSCSSPYPIECAVWGTLVDGAGQQLGGEGSSAGTGEVDPGTSDVIDWTFSQPGTYYLAMDSGGQMPSYTDRYDVVGAAAPAPTAPAPTAATIASLRVSSPQHGHVVRARIRLGRAVRTLAAKLVAYRRTSHGLVPVTLGRLALADLPGGSRTLRVPLNRVGRRALARNGRLRMRLRVTVTPQSGATAKASRLLTLLR